MMGLRRIPGQSAGNSAPPAPAWPPATALHLHPGIAYTGTPDDVQSATFPNGITANAVGTGNPVTIDGDGLHFWQGKYLSYVPPVAIPYSGMAAFARVTMRAFPTDPWPNGDDRANRAIQIPLGVISPTARLLGFSYHNNYAYCTLGNKVSFSIRDVHELGAWNTDNTLTMGCRYSTRAEDTEDGGFAALWLEGAILRGKNASEPITPTEWVIGKDMYGTLHEGVLFTQHQGSTDPLFPPGASSQWVMDNLEGAI